MGFETLTLLSLAFKAISAVSQTRALDRQSRQAAEQSNLEQQELQRQREAENEIAQGKKAERVREADRLNASNIAALADGGGLGGSNVARFAGEVGFYEGIDLARLESNRRSKVEGLAARQTFSRNKALNTIDDIQGQKKAVGFGFLGSVVGAGLSIRSQREKVETTKQTSTGS